eukprot:4288543-Amphidinium_carterae.1
MNGTILRPTKRLPNQEAMNKRRRRGTLHAPPPSHAARWEELAMFKSIWLAAGLEYVKGAEKTHITADDQPRGCIERINTVGQRQGLGISNWRRLYRAVGVETLSIYVTIQNEHIDHLKATMTAVGDLSKPDR